MTNDSTASRKIPSFGHALTGHLTIGVIKSIFVLPVLWFFGAIGLTPEFGIRTAAITAFGSVIAVEVAATVVERPSVVKNQHSEPGGVVRAIAIATCAPVMSGIISYLILESSAAILLATGVVTLCHWIFLVFVDRIWERGESLEDFRTKHKAVKNMTRVTFGP